MKEFVKSVSTSIVSAILIALIFFIWNDFVNNPSNLSGVWEIEDTITGSKSAQFEGLKIYLSGFLQQAGQEISGTAEKVADQPVSGEKRVIEGVNRVRLDIAGTVKNNFISKDSVVIHMIEHGSKRETSVIMDLNVIDNETLEGVFRTSAADSEGRSIWRRR